MWKKGQSGNPGGRPQLAKAWEAATGGKTMSDVTAEALRMVYERTLQGPQPNHKGDANDPDWRFAAQKVLEYSAGKPKEQVEITSGVSPEQEALLEVLRLTPHERRIAQDSTAAEDDAAAEAFDDGAR